MSLTSIIVPKTIRIFMLLFIVMCYMGCSSVVEKPEIRDIKNLNVEKSSMQEIVISGDVVIYNPNAVAGTLSSMDIDVFNKQILLGTLNHNNEVRIPPNDEIAIPISISTSPKNLLDKKSDLISGALQMLLDKTIEVSFKGNVQLKFAKIPFNLDVDQDKVLNI